jgi:predicted transposase YdaD
MKKKKEIIINNQDGKEDTYETDLLSIKNLHDNLFSRIFTRKEKALAFFKKYLPASLLEIIDLSSIELVDSKHALELGINLYNDLVYKFRLKSKPGFCIIAFEHQSTIDKNMPFRFLKYNVYIIQKHLDQGHKKIPILKDVLFYTGKRPWKASTKLDDHYDDPIIGSEYLHLKEFTLIQLPVNNDHPDYVDKDLGYCLAAFKCGREKGKSYEEFKKFKQAPIFRDYFYKLPKSERMLAGIYIGIFASGSMEELEKIVNLVITSEQEKKEFMQTIAQQYQKEGMVKGMEKGMVKGMEKGIRQVAKSMLSEFHLDADFVQKVTKLNKETIQNLLKDKDVKKL